MTVRFGNKRLLSYIVIWALSGTVLGLSANFASIFLPNLHKEFVVFALVISSLTILILLLSVNWAQPWSELSMLIVLCILWLAMAAWSTDLIGYVECSMLGGQRTPTKNGNMSYQTYCTQMRVIQATSWMLFGLLIVFIGLLVVLVSRAENLGHPGIWYDHIAVVPWFGELPGFGHGQRIMMMPQMPMAYGPGMMQTPMYGPQMPGMMAPGMVPTMM